MNIIPKFQNSGKVLTKQQIEQNKKKQQILNQNGVKVKIDGNWGPWQQEQYNKIMSKKNSNRLKNLITQTIQERNIVMRPLSTERQDNTRTNKPSIPQKVTRTYKPSVAYIYDADKANLHRKMQSFYNNNFFGYGVFGNQTNYDATTPEGQAAIKQNFNYAKDNAFNMLADVALTGATTQAVATLRGATPFTNGRRTLGTLDDILAMKRVGSGAEAVVVKDSPFSVLKVFWNGGGHGPIEARSSIPGYLKLNFKGYVKNGKKRVPAFTQQKGKPITDKEYPKAVDKITKKMKKNGYEKVQDDYNPQDNVFVNWIKQRVVGDIDKGNILKDWLGRFRISDASTFTVPEWLEMGYTLTPIK